MDRFKDDRSIQKQIDQLSKENRDLKLIVKKQQNKHKHFNIIGIILIVTGLLFLGFLIYGEYNEYNSARKIKKLQEQKKASYNGADVQQGILPEYRKMYETNSDLAGWIVIDGTDINYPVVQSKVYQEFYLNHNFDGEKEAAGRA